MEATPYEISTLKMHFRVTVVCDHIGWDDHTRRVGTVLLSLGPGVGTSLRAISRAAFVERRSVQRRIVEMIESGIAQKSGNNGFVSYTELGRALHLETWRDIMRIAAGKQNGFSEKTLGLVERVGGSDLTAYYSINKLTFKDELAFGDSIEKFLLKSQ